MRPFLFSIGGMQIPSFFFMIMVGTLACAFYCYWIAGRIGMKHREYYLDLGMIGMICGVLGSRIFHILVEAPDYYLEHPTHVWQFWRGGFVSYGAYIGGTLSALAYLKWRKVNLWEYIDVLVLGVPLIQLSIRIACLLAGCCYGKPTDLPWAVTFTNPASTAYYYYPNIPLHPTQLYSATHALLLFIGINLFYFKKKNRFPGQCLPVMFIFYFIPRGIIEFWRADTDRGLWFHGTLSTGQVTGIFGVIFFVALYFYLKHRARSQTIKL